MKTLLFLILSLGYITATSQGIIAGDTITPGIIYVDLDPDIYVEVPYPSGSDAYNLDYNNDGSPDIKFTANWQSAMGFSSESSSCVALGQNEIACLTTNPNWVDCIGLNESISSFQYWDDGGTLKSSWDSYDTSYTHGVFNNGYIGFRFNSNNQTKYGWIKANAGYSSVTLHEYAYEGNLTEIDNHGESSDISIRPNPVKNILNIDFPEGQNITNQSFFIVNILGKKVIEGNVSLSNPSIDCSSIPAGYYFFYLTDKDRYLMPQKFLKL